MFSIMPPGTWHQVYTPTPSYAGGGHFYTLESLHLTEFSRSFDHHPNGRFATNAEHDALRVLCRMAMALPIFQEERGMSGCVCLYSIWWLMNPSPQPSTESP